MITIFFYSFISWFEVYVMLAPRSITCWEDPRCCVWYGSNSAIATDPVDKATTFFTLYEQVEMNDFDLVDFWGIGPPYVDFHGYQVLEDCLENLKVVYRNHRDFM